MAAMGGDYFHYIAYSKTLENLLLHNGSMDFIIIWYECSLGGPLLDSLKKILSDKKHGRSGWSLLSPWHKATFLKKVFSIMPCWVSL